LRIKQFCVGPFFFDGVSSEDKRLRGNSARQWNDVGSKCKASHKRATSETANDGTQFLTAAAELHETPEQPRDKRKRID